MYALRSLRLLVILCLFVLTVSCAAEDDEETDGDDPDGDSRCSEGFAWNSLYEMCLPVETDGDDGGPDGDSDAFDGDEESIDLGCDENDADPLRAMACTMLRYVNRDRALFPEESGHAGPLVWDEEMWNVALAHSQDMCDRHFFDHYNPDDKSPFDRMDDAGVSYRSAGENIALNPDILDSQYRFMAECTCKQNHRSNCLNPTFTRVGIGIVECLNPLDGFTGKYYFVTQNFRALMNESIQSVPYCNIAGNKNQYWTEPASTAPVSSYFGLEEPDSGPYTTCDGTPPSRKSGRRAVGVGAYLVK